MTGGMKFLADESCDFTIIRELREAGIEVVSVLEQFPGITDEEVLSIAHKEERIVITEDRDFGRLIHLSGDRPLPVCYLRYPFSARRQIIDKLLSLISKKEPFLQDSFIVIEPAKIRIRKYR